MFTSNKETEIKLFILFWVFSPLNLLPIMKVTFFFYSIIIFDVIIKIKSKMDILPGNFLKAVLKIFFNRIGYINVGGILNIIVITIGNWQPKLKSWMKSLPLHLTLILLGKA